MKHYRVGFLVALSFLCSCSGMKTLNLKILEPSTVSFSPDVNTVALVNRALPGTTTTLNDVVDILSTQSLNDQLQGRQQVLEGLNTSLIQSPRLKSVIVPEQFIGDRTGAVFPAPLSWEVINKICSDNQTDAVVALETFNVIVDITHTMGNVEMKDQFGISLPSVQFDVTQKVTVYVGFRVYDPKTQTILDQYNYSYWRTWRTQGTSLIAAMAALQNRQTSINLACNTTGTRYENRISPIWKYEQRKYFRKGGSSPMAIGGRMARVGNWVEAEKNWNQVLATSSKRKELGKASYNLALAAEAKGDLLGAKDWLSKSYGQYNNKQATYYQNIITRRYDEMIRKEQQFIKNQSAPSDSDH